MYTIDDPKNRAVGFNLSEGMEVPEALAKFKFARQKSKWPVPSGDHSLSSKLNIDHRIINRPAQQHVD
jgi:hypothetical protein